MTDTLTGTYNPYIVVVSALVAVLASYTALQLAAQVTASSSDSGAGCGSPTELRLKDHVNFANFLGKLSPVPKINCWEK